jgi:tyrosyl-tRNA synthetase
MNIQEQVEFLTSGGVEVLPGGKSHLVELLKKAEQEKRPLRVKLGIDPTGADLHLGHTVCLNLLRKFQRLGHLPVLLIGGFTAQLGDPTGRNEARPPLTADEVGENARTFLEQTQSVLDLSKTEVVNNSDWLTPLKLAEIIKLASSTTINQLIGKEAFGERIESGHPLYLHEIFYPILQGYDSVAIKADIEIGGKDQRFNVLSGRDLQKLFNQPPQLIMLLPLLVGLDGKKKMSKTSDNYIAVKDTPEDMFGKTMSLPDELMIEWFELCTDFTTARILQIKEELSQGVNPRDIKMLLASTITEQFYGKEAAEKAKESFVTKFQKREIPEIIEEFKYLEQNILDLMLEAGLVPSKSEARRLITGQGVKINSEKATLESELKAGDILQVGKRKFVKLI